MKKGFHELLITKDVQQVYSTGSSFAALKGDGSVTTWGYRAAGGDCYHVEHRLLRLRIGVPAAQLKGGVQHIYSTSAAFAAVKDDGSVLTWGKPEKGADSSAVREQLREGVKQIFSTSKAFAALKDDGTVVTWGMTEWGFDRAEVQEELHKNAGETFLNTKLHKYDSKFQKYCEYVLG